MPKNINEKIDKIQIVEPPIEELTKGRNQLKRTCLTGCGCIVLFVAALAVALWIAVGPGPSTTKTLPANFPNDIPLYDKDNIQSITFIPGRYKSRSTKIAAFFPKIILSPILLNMTDRPSTTTETGGIGGYARALKTIWQLIATPPEDAVRDSVNIEWTNLDAEPSFVINYYKKELTKKGYQVELIQNDNHTKRITFQNNTNLNGTLTAYGDEENKPGTESAVMIVNLPTATN